MFAGEPPTATTRIDPAWAWAPYQPGADRPWDLKRAGHLLRRAGFGATWAELQKALADGPGKTIDRLLAPGPEADAFNRRLDELESPGDSVEALRAWWLRRMLETPHPLLEKMTLFWHGHLAASRVRVQGAALMGSYVRTLRKHALGRFDAMLAEVACDPAMLTWLGAGANRRARPTDSLARTLLERFTLGPGKFSEQDVQEAARAFTGWFVFRGEARFIPREHDEGVKRVLGSEGRFAAADVVRIALAQPAAPEFLVRKLYRWLVSETDEPRGELIAPLAGRFAKDYDVAGLVETVLRSNLFFSPGAYRRRVKGPVEYALGILRPLEALAPTERLGHELAELGQGLYEPPTSQGWPGGKHWINQATLLGRARLARELLAAKGPYGGKADPAAVGARHAAGPPARAAEFLLDLYLQGDVAAGVRAKLTEEAASAAAGADGLRRFAQAVVTLPEFQLA